MQSWKTNYSICTTSQKKTYVHMHLLQIVIYGGTHKEATPKLFLPKEMRILQHFRIA